MLADAFSSVFVTESHGPLPELVRDSEKCNISDLEIDSASVKSELLKLNVYKSCGPDGVHPKLLKALAEDFRFVNAVTELLGGGVTSVYVRLSHRIQKGQDIGGHRRT